MAEFDQFAGDYEDVLNDTIQWSGDTAEYFQVHKASCLQRMYRSDPPTRVLDFGCGVGGVTRYLAAAFPLATIDGFDVSRDSIDSIDPQLRARGTFHWELDELGDDYDLVVIANVLHHIEPADRPGVMADLGTRLADGGRVVIFEHNPMNPVTRRVVATCPFDENAVLLWPGESRELLRTAGLRKIHRKYVLFFPGFLSKLRGLERGLGWCPLGAQYMAWGEHG